MGEADSELRAIAQRGRSIRQLEVFVETRFPRRMVHTQMVFTYAGFFHLATGHDSPICSLLAALDSEADVSDALIVLPEAFNLGRPYREGGLPDVHRDYMIDELSRISRQRGLTFVVGLMEPRRDDGEKPRSSAYCNSVGQWTTTRLSAK